MWAPDAQICAPPSHWRDLMKKVRKALEVEGPAFLNILAPCNRGCRSKTDDSIALSKLAVQTCYWPLYEIEDGVTRITFNPKEKKPVEEFIKPQGRFRHFFAPGGEELLKRLQEDIDKEWDRLNRESQKDSPEESRKG